ncbi:polysaccharide pyruvyl transferase family protein [Pantanalinema rosaneae CENA516]|uniref:polysaccharide pyruvyl transferase family protein n=1 Tax=Pantanalinema rosaneae TaxID=1620701 RepID=UPI003D6EAB2F
MHQVNSKKSSVPLITIFDTSVCSSNLGDLIIMDAVRKILREVFRDALFVSLQTHDRISRKSYSLISQSLFTFVGGTNLLMSGMGNPRRFKQWEIGLPDAFYVKDSILLGVGWWQYQEKVDLFSSILYKKLLNQSYLHSVRDSYTEKKLKSMGIENVINTSCPTMWLLDEKHCIGIPSKRAQSVLLTLTEYKQHKDADLELFQLLRKEYEKIYFWTQQPGDYKYMKEISGDEVIYLYPSLEALDDFLLKNEIDYIGTRLHAGIRALQNKRRTLILAVDNRAVEISRDTNLPVIQRNDYKGIEEWINSCNKTKILLPENNIQKWKNQFLNFSCCEGSLD